MQDDSERKTNNWEIWHSHSLRVYGIRFSGMWRRVVRCTRTKISADPAFPILRGSNDESKFSSETLAQLWLRDVTPQKTTTSVTRVSVRHMDSALFLSTGYRNLRQNKCFFSRLQGHQFLVTTNEPSGHVVTTASQLWHNFRLFSLSSCCNLSGKDNKLYSLFPPILENI